MVELPVLFTVKKERRHHRAHHSRRFGNPTFVFIDFRSSHSRAFDHRFHIDLDVQYRCRTQPFCIAFIPVAGLIISNIGKALKRTSDSVQKEQGDFLSLIEETLGGLTIVKAFLQKRIFIKNSVLHPAILSFQQCVDQPKKLGIAHERILGIGVIGALLWYGGKMVLIEESLLDLFSFHLCCCLQHPHSCKSHQ